MTYQPNCTLPEELWEQIAAEEMDAIPEMIRLLVNEAMRLLLLLRQFFILPMGIAYLVLIRLAFEVVSKHTEEKPERVWRFYTWLVAVEFAILYLAARI